MSTPAWREKYELVVGLEVHAQLLTKSKAYSNDPNAYGDRPNTNVSVVSLGHPGTLPVLNERSVEYAIRLGLALNCDITEKMHFARKNYFYPDLPKGYQITQDTTPICTGGEVIVEVDGKEKRIGLTRIHMEEDAGKSIHDVDPFNTLIDLNRAGVPLVEIVSEPDIRTSDEAYAYLGEIRRLVRYLEICDGNMEEGSLRCDANISLRPKGQKEFGMRTEVKNMNSLRNVQRAIEHEAVRQAAILDEGGTIHQETRTFDAVNGTTIGLRSKEDAHDYRYFPEPDLQPLTVTQERVEEVRKKLPPLPRELRDRYMNELKLSAYDAGVLTDDKATALYYEELIKSTSNYKSAANWVTGDVRSWINERGVDMNAFPLSAEKLATVIMLIDDGRISHSVASQKLFPMLMEAPEKSAEELATKNDLLLEDNDDAITTLMDEIMNKYPEKVDAYRAGNKGLLGLFMGEIMKGTKGKADPRKANQVVRKMLEQ